MQKIIAKHKKGKCKNCTFLFINQKRQMKAIKAGTEIPEDELIKIETQELLKNELTELAEKIETITTDEPIKKKIKAHNVELKLKNQYNNPKKPLRISNHRGDFSTATIALNKKRALCEWRLDFVFENSPEELLAVIEEYDKETGEASKPNYKTRALSINLKATK